VLTGGAVGLAAVAGTSLVRTPAADAATTNITQITPTGDATGVNDTTAIMTAIAALTDGGTIYLGPGEFYITYVPGVSTLSPYAISLPVQTSAGASGGMGVNIQGCGSATVVYVVGNYTGFFVHRSAQYGQQYGKPGQQTAVFLRDFVVDGTNAGASSVGVDIGDGWGYDLNLVIVNFTGASAIGLYIINRLMFTEKGRFRAHLMNNTTAAKLSVDNTATSDVSHEYNIYDFYIFGNENQQGVVTDNGSSNGGCVLWLHGNMSNTASTNGTPTGGVAALTITGSDGNGNYTQFYSSEIVMKIEGNPGVSPGNTPPYAIYLGSSSNAIQQCHGIITHSLTTSVLNNGEFSFRGLIPGDSGLSVIYTGSPGSGETSSSQPTLPATNTAQQNYGPDTMVYVNGGTVTGVSLSGVATNQTSGGFFLPAGGYITVKYTGTPAPTWTWVPASRSSF
jgi:hypothetical protein